MELLKGDEQLDRPNSQAACMDWCKICCTFFRFVINTTANHLARYSLHLLLPVKNFIYYKNCIKYIEGLGGHALDTTVKSKLVFSLVRLSQIWKQSISTFKSQFSNRQNAKTHPQKHICKFLLGRSFELTLKCRRESVPKPDRRRRASPWTGWTRPRPRRPPRPLRPKCRGCKRTSVSGLGALPSGQNFVRENNWPSDHHPAPARSARSPPRAGFNIIKLFLPWLNCHNFTARFWCIIWDTKWVCSCKFAP